jgi:hypothetical protein
MCYISGVNEYVTRITCTTVALLLLLCGPAAFRGTHFDKQWFNKLQRHRHATKELPQYQYVAKAEALDAYTYFLQYGCVSEMMMFWWVDEWMWRHALMLLYFCASVLYHTNGHAIWEQTRFVTQSRYMIPVFFVLCVSLRTGRVRSPWRSQNIYHRLTAPCLSGWER